MSASSCLIRVVFERFDGREWQVRVNDLGALDEALGSSVLADFLTAFVHADRLSSLVAFYEPLQRAEPSGSPAGLRNYFAYCYFLIGTLKELGLALGRLRGSLKQRGLLDLDAWRGGLQQWENWSNRSDISLIRKRAAFHVDRDVLVTGVREQGQLHGPTTIVRGSSPRLLETWYPLAELALLSGLDLSQEALEAPLVSSSDLLHVHGSLETEFMRVVQAVAGPIIRLRTHGEASPTRQQV